MILMNFCPLPDIDTDVSLREPEFTIALKFPTVPFTMNEITLEELVKESLFCGRINPVAENVVSDKNNAKIMLKCFIIWGFWGELSILVRKSSIHPKTYDKVLILIHYSKFTGFVNRL